MPSSTTKQARTMAGAAHDPAFAAKVGIPVKVAKEFNQADKGTALLSQAMKAKHLRSRRPPDEQEPVDNPREERGEYA